MRLTASAPGKLLLAGEYAVLSGQPALVMAADRRVRVTLADAQEWALISDGGAPEPLAPDFPGGAERPATPLAVALWCAVQIRGRQPPPLRIEADSRALQHEGLKLGLGSSAAVVVALAAALAQHDATEAETLTTCVRMHDLLQGAPGSGFDVAAAMTGGWFRYERDGDAIETAAVAAPPAPVRYIWTGVAARTGGFVERFRVWERENRHSGAVIGGLGTAARAAIRAADAGHAEDFVAAIALNAARLAELAASAGLDIFAGGHHRLVRLADRHGVTYKPCGAGGGDIGMATSTDESRLAAFIEAVRGEGFQPIELECDPYGVRVQQQEDRLPDS